MTPEQARALLASPELLATASATDLRVAERLRRQWPSDLVAAAGEQAELRERAGAKTANADRLLLTRAGLEQASSDAVAEHRASRFADVDGRVVDLCCGIGFDLRALAAVCRVVGVDRDETSAVCASHNSRAPVAVADVHHLRLSGIAAAFVDPARRQGDRRGGYEPALPWCLSLPVDRVAAKVAPGVEVGQVPVGWEIEFVADGRALKEACLWSPPWAGPSRRATIVGSGAAVTMASDGVDRAPRLAPPGAFVVDPSPAVTRAGLVRQLGAALDAWQIDAKVAFLFCDRAPATPFGRTLQVEASLPFSVKALSKELRRLDFGAIDLRRRGLAGDVEELRRRLRPQGTRRGVVLLTRMRDKPWTIVCSQPDPA